ncbi:MAG: hypothetical protein J6X33_04400 [Clostridiales bacterium]|nr:hypothetical protein [Clostridiales bacterium]
MLKFRVMVLGQVKNGDWKLTFDTYKEAKEFGDFIVGCQKNLTDLEDKKGFSMDEDKPSLPYLIIAEDENEADEGRQSA